MQDQESCWVVEVTFAVSMLKMQQCQPAGWTAHQLKEVIGIKPQTQEILFPNSETFLNILKNSAANA